MTVPTTNGHDKKGRFLPGNPGGPGNPHVHKVAKLRAAMLSAVTEKDMRTITKKLVALATDGDLKAIELLLNRICGKPEATTGPTVAIQNNVSGQHAISEQQRSGTIQRILDRIQETRSTGRHRQQLFPGDGEAGQANVIEHEGDGCGAG